jgi:hypothetical protein
MAKRKHIPGGQNKVFINVKGMIEFTVVGKQSKETVHAMAEQARAFAKEMRAKKEPVLILDDLRKMNARQSTEVARAVGHEARRIRFRKVAMLGSGSTLLKYGANFIIQGLGMRRKMKYFTDRKEAEEWLLKG